MDPIFRIEFVLTDLDDDTLAKPAFTKDNDFFIYVNRKRWSELPRTTQAQVIKHEFYHAITQWRSKEEAA